MARNRIPGIPQDYFLESINEFCQPGNYDWYRCSGWTMDELHRRMRSYAKEEIHGSLQSKGISKNQNIKGNTTDHKYGFYCSAIYQINVDDFIYDDWRHAWLHVDKITDDYIEWGVRGVELTMINLTEYQDLALAVKFLNGEETL